jgi:putative ABC transport system permease protein
MKFLLITLRTALRNILRNRMRTLLTMLGIIIGVAAVIIMVSVGKGAEADINQRISALGSNVLMVRPGGSTSHGVRLGADSWQSLKLSDIDALKKKCTQIAAVSGLVRANGQFVANGTNWPTNMEGANVEYFEIRQLKLSSGNFFTERDVRTSRKVAVIGSTIAKEVFGDIDPVGQQFRFGKQPMTVIGVLASRGQSGMGGDQDDIVIAPITTVFYRIAGDSHLNQIIASANSREAMTAAQDEMTAVLRKEHKVRGENDDFSIRNQSDILEAATSMSRTLTLLLSAIAAVSLLVGGIGIMNIMLVSVTERTREIGIRMALGARGIDILLQFLIEAVVLCSLGGIAGILLALGACKILEQTVGMNTILSPATVIFAFGFSAMVGVFFGFYPARKAANLNPIDALRYE